VNQNRRDPLDTVTERRIWSICAFDQTRCAFDETRCAFGQLRKPNSNPNLTLTLNSKTNPKPNTKPNPNPNPHINLIPLQVYCAIDQILRNSSKTALVHS